MMFLLPKGGYRPGIHIQLRPESLSAIHSMTDQILMKVFKVFLNANRLARAGFFLCRQIAGKTGQLKEIDVTKAMPASCGSCQ